MFAKHVKYNIGFICPLERISRVLSFVAPWKQLLSAHPTLYVDLRLVFITKVGKGKKEFKERWGQSEDHELTKVLSFQVKKYEIHCISQYQRKKYVLCSSLVYLQEPSVHFQYNPIDECVCPGVHAWVYVIDNILKVTGQCLATHLGSQVIWQWVDL